MQLFYERRMMRQEPALHEILRRETTAFEHDPPASLLHIGVWAENILAGDEGELTGLVDWDRALWGDPEIEYAVLDYCGISELEFWEGYGANDNRESGGLRSGVASSLLLALRAPKVHLHPHREARRS